MRFRSAIGWSCTAPSPADNAAHVAQGEDVKGLMGFHIDGFARERLNMPARLVIKIPDGVGFRDAACAPIAFSTVEHMLFDNAKLQPGETVLVHAGGSGIGTAAIKMAKAIGCTVITTVGDDAKAEKAKMLGADHVINYRADRFEHAVRKLTAKKGVDVVFEHVGADTFNGSLLSLKRGGRLVTCGATSGPAVTFNLMQLFQQQYKIFGSFGASLRNIRTSLAKMAAGVTPVIDSEFALEHIEEGLKRLESRQVFGKIIVNF
jgi:alcohol dehydrogenase